MKKIEKIIFKLLPSVATSLIMFEKENKKKDKLNKSERKSGKKNKENKNWVGGARVETQPQLYLPGPGASAALVVIYFVQTNFQIGLFLRCWRLYHIEPKSQTNFM